ncbi:MAG TPA: hypothetical protein VGN19_05780 [Pedococcus sp.]|nr:hypothetical protein [Pedococcus sp.]
MSDPKGYLKVSEDIRLHAANLHGQIIGLLSTVEVRPSTEFQRQSLTNAATAIVNTIALVEMAEDAHRDRHRLPPLNRLSHQCRYCGIGRVTDLRRRCEKCAEPEKDYVALIHERIAKDHDVPLSVVGLPEDNPQVRLIQSFHERTQRCLGRGEQGEAHMDCAMVEQRHREGNHDDCLPVEDEENGEPACAEFVEMLSETIKVGDTVMFNWEDKRIVPDPDPNGGSLTVEHVHDWQPMHDGRTFVNLSDGSDAVSYEQCTACLIERSMPMKRADGRRPDWDRLSGDEKVRARIEGTEYPTPTLEDRLRFLEARVDHLEQRPNPYDVIRGSDGR